MRRWRRYRTPVLAVVTTALLVWSTVVIFEVPLAEVAGFLAVCVAGVGIIMVLAFITSWLLQRFRS
ncbi:MAG TPA: hypothetical protein DIW43_19120 [Spongiibacteraceae bacterium]|nr:hypothetical protein [Spongiibacteraceae bacterium]HCS29574.1 hypothetical protein [Spongiibacteraceae bacterium]|tara:strand:- start:250 stop:447 length:198 start_codon:yes stop_codon:yes gene_type:complete